MSWRSLEGRAASSLRVVVDAANGAASALARTVFERVGADVVVIGDQPDGTNINDACGATYPSTVAEAVLAHGADVGIALDGDADRLIAVDHTGRVVDGDHIIAIAAIDLLSRGDAGQRHGRGHHDDQPRIPPRHARRQASASSPPMSATATCSKRWPTVDMSSAASRAGM